MVCRNLRQAHLLEVGLTQISGDHDFFNVCFFPNMTDFKADFIIDSMIDKYHQVVISNWLSLRHIIINQILPFFPSTKYTMVLQHGPFSLHYNRAASKVT
jgi:hypothetical protein